MKITRKLIEGYIEMEEETIKINKEWEKADAKWPINKQTTSYKSCKK